jgi:aspartyl aminopeptidase
MEPKTVEFANDFVKFLNQSASHFHAVFTASLMLEKAGYLLLDERNAEAWKNLIPGKKYYFTRNQSTLIAFAIGKKYVKGNGFTIIGAHTDSPVLKVKPVSKKVSSECLQLTIEPYGGGLWYTWLDRDLSLAGRAIVEYNWRGGNGELENCFKSQLVKIDKPILKIPSLAIHLNRDVDSQGLLLNKQLHLSPILATKTVVDHKLPEDQHHHQIILKMVADELKVEPSKICDLELSLYDTQPACLGGAMNEFVFGRGLDNLMMSYISLRSLIDSTADVTSLDDETNIRMITLFDHEEIGSMSSMGADSALLPSILKNITDSDEKIYASAIQNSILVSADMAHAVHPNYSEKHDPMHGIYMHKGLAIKYNVNQRYATNAISAHFITEVAKKHGLHTQKFTAKNDIPCGSTIGPILSSGVGIRTVDVGIGQWAMHSIRETAGVTDAWSSYELFKYLFFEYPELNKRLNICTIASL